MRPRMLDLFSGAGGAARGYTLAGFDVTGVDHAPQPRYLLSGAVAFVQADALEYVRDHGREYDVIHASPPCQGYSRATAWRGDRNNHPRLIEEVRERLLATGLPYVIENVQEARWQLRFPVLLCGSNFGLRVRRHRYFEGPSLPLILVPSCQHRRSDYCFDHGGKQTERAYADAMGCDWMTVHEAREAIPPAFTEFIGRHLLNVLSPHRPAPVP